MLARVAARDGRLLADPVLRTPADEVTDFDRQLRTLVRDLWDRMESNGAAGLAAPQVGTTSRVFTYHCDGCAGHMVNPRVEIVGAERQDDMESCLSVPGPFWNCPRYRRVLAHGWNMHGDPVRVEGTGLLARCLQHEVDHLDGVLFVDRLDAATRASTLREIQRAGESAKVRAGRRR